MLLAGLLASGDAHAQTASCTSHAPDTWDAQISVSVYCAGAPLPTISAVADRMALPLFAGAPLAAGGYAIATRSQPRFGDAYRLGVSMTGAYVVTHSLKRLIGRPRPYATGLVERRDLSVSAEEASILSLDDRLSMPSGHATLAAALATSWSLSHPYWYVIAPAAVWATATSASRVHLGVHYVSDVAVGALIGSGAAVLVHSIRSSITPSVFDTAEGSRPKIGVVVLL